MYKKVLALIIFLFIVSFGFSAIKVEAKNGQNNKRDASFTSNVTTDEDVYGMKHTIDSGFAESKGAKHDQLVNIFQMKTDGFSSKLVNWSMQTNNAEFARVTIMAAARDYERTHPGWIVLGGINADQYYFLNGNNLAVDGSAVYQPQPYFPLISDGEKRFTVSPYGDASSVVGFKNDGSVDSFVTNSGGAGGYILKVYDENGDFVSFDVANINKPVSGDSISVWSPIFSEVTYGTCTPMNVTATASLYVIEEAELAYLSNSETYSYCNGTIPGRNSFFGKGTISSIKEEFVLNKGQFAIETNNQDVKNALAVGKKVIVEQQFGSVEMNACNEASGYHAIHRIGGVDHENNSGYDTRQYSRSLFGRKADGTYVLMTADFVFNKNTDGMNFDECNALADAYGVVDMFQMDGGGSVTAMTRDKNGNFVVTNVPKDSGNPKTPRANFNYLFFVARDPGIVIDDQNSDYHSVTLEKIPTTGDAVIENIKVKNGKDIYSFDEQALTIDGLQPDTEYIFDVEYDIVYNGKRVTKQYTVKYKTDPFRFPVTPLKIGQVTKDSIEIIKRAADDKDNIRNIVLKIGSKEYKMGDSDSFIIEELEGSSSYTISYIYDYYDPVTGALYKKADEAPLTVTTKSFQLPNITKFEVAKESADSIKFSCSYNDFDDVAIEAYILCNGEKHSVTSKNDNVTIRDIDLNSNIYKFIFVIVYEDKDTQETLSISSEEIIKGTEAPAPVVPVVPDKKGCSCRKNEVIISLFSALTLCSYVLLKKKY